MMKTIRLGSLSSLLVLGAVSVGHADSTTVINRNVLRQMVQLSVAYTQARISYTSPPFPVQFVNTTPFAAVRQVRSALGPIVSPTASQKNNNPLFAQAQRLPGGSYTIVATPSSYTLTFPTGTSQTTAIPANFASLLPPQSVSGTVSVPSNVTPGRVVTVAYTFRR